MRETIQYLTEVTVAEITGRALSTLRNDRSIGRGIPYIKIGRSVRYDIYDVVRFMEAHKISTEDSVYVDVMSSSADQFDSENAARCVFSNRQPKTESEVLIPRQKDSLSNDAPNIEGGWNGPHIRGQKNMNMSCLKSVETRTERLTNQRKDFSHEDL